MAVDKVFSSVVSRGIEKVHVSELKGGLLGVKADAANKAVKEAVLETAQRVGDEILATYKKVDIIKHNPDGSYIKRTTGLNEVTFETVQNQRAKEYVSLYERTTPRGTYRVEADINGVTHTEISSPIYGKRSRDYVGGKVLKPVTAEHVQVLKAKHEATKGRIVDHREQEYRGEKSIFNVFENGNKEQIDFGYNGKLKNRWLELDGGKKMLAEDCEENITNYVTKIKSNSVYDSFAPISYHKNPVTGEISKLNVEKFTDEFGSSIVRTSYEFPNGLENAEIFYTQKGAFSKGSFVSEKFGKVEVTPFEFIINGKEVSRNELHSLTGMDYNSDYGKFFEGLFGKAMEEVGVSKKFFPSYKGSWENL